MRKQVLSAVIALGAVSALAVACASQEGNSAIALPDGYRSWTHVKSMIIQPGHGLADPFEGIHHIYANDIAMQGYKTGNFADGSVLVFDLLKVTEADDTIQEADRVLIGVMEKSSTNYSGTDGWGYEGFAAGDKEKRLVTDGATQCHACHAGTPETGFVFSQYRN